ncbi:MAG TPA: LysR substrate-binding domain-containing protein [Methylomirabilota bacterium]|nr:LysR substrate-binding domain-containing protein [Methylomirabilota bacterium]
MEMHQIRYFLAVSRTLNFTRAAEECNVSQPSLTRAIQMLEGELGGELLRRERGQSHLTELGQRMLPLMQQCYESALAAQSVADVARKGEATPLALAVANSIDLALVAAALAEVSRAYPATPLRVSRGTAAEIADFLKKGEAELAVAGPLEAPPERLDCWPLFSEPYALFVHREHRLAGRNAVESAQLAGEHFLFLAGCDMTARIAAVLGEKGGAITGAHHVTTHRDLVDLLEAGVGIAILPGSTTPSEHMRRVPLNGLDASRTVALYGVAGRRRSTAAATLLNLLRAADWPRALNARP